MRPSVHILLRLILVVILSAGVYHVAFHTYFWLTSLWMLLFIIILIADIIRIHRRAEKDLRNFLLAIAQHDFATVLPSRIARDYPRMTFAYTTINKVFQEISLSEESSQSFLEVIVEQVGVALIGFRASTGEVTLVNKVAKDMLGRSFLRNISSLQHAEPRLYELLLEMKSGDRAMINLGKKQENMHLSIVSRELVLEGYNYKLFAIQNIRSELEEKEIDSWIRLIRVLTHEIKNSAIPIATLSEVIAETITENNGNRKDLRELSQAEWADLSQGLKTIRRRSKGLVDFIETYGKFTKLPRPEKQRFLIHDLMDTVKGLLQSALNEKEIALTIHSQKDLAVYADPIQIEQVLINLLKNAIESVTHGQGKITIDAVEKDNSIHITVKDNGAGMDESTLENVFIPFFTTKQKGTGVGLSISRQIIRAHRGDLRVTSLPGEGSEFEIILRK